MVAGTANDAIFMALPMVDNFWQVRQLSLSLVDQVTAKGFLNDSQTALLFLQQMALLGFILPPYAMA